MIKSSNEKSLMTLLDKYNLSLGEKEELLNIINHIFMHDEFQRRMTSEFQHHDEITLGEHILEDTIVTYILSRKHREKSNYDLETALKISMMHDLYVKPWQNNESNKPKRFINKHGFRHPNEAIINACIWFPEDFTKEEETKKIIDGVLHHMYPLPVKKFDISSEETMELRNFNMIGKIDKNILELIKQSGNRSVVGSLSVAPSKYKEGRVMSLSDKIVSMSNLKGSNISAYTALLNGNNKSLALKNENKCL